MKLRPIMIALLLVMTLTLEVVAADALHRMMHGDEHQDAVVVLELLKEEATYFEAKVHHTLEGSIKDEIIQLNKEGLWLLGFGRRDSIAYELTQGDYCVISIQKERTGYKQAWLAVKTDHHDLETLSCHYLHHNADIDILQWYIRSGGKEKDYYVNGNRAYVRNQEGSEEITLPVVGNYNPFEDGHDDDKEKDSDFIETFIDDGLPESEPQKVLEEELTSEENILPIIGLVWCSLMAVVFIMNLKFDLGK